MITKATVVGTGAMGTVAGQVLAANRVHVAWLALRPERAAELVQTRENRRYLPGYRLDDRVAPTADPQAALAGTELVVSAVPCQFLRTAWQRVAPFVPPDAPLCSVTKGLEVETLARPSQILAQYAPGRRVAVLSGPSIAPEIARCLPATVVVACEHAATGMLIQSVMSTSWFRVYTNADVLGVELAGAVKNVVAIAAGILDGLQAGDNAKSALITRGLVEISRLGVAMGARPETFTGLAGIGDLVTTCVSPIGRNRSAGEQIGRGATVEQVVRSSRAVIEGIPTTRGVLRLAARHRVDMPITSAVHDILFSGKDPLTAISELMQRPPKAETGRA